MREILFRGKHDPKYGENWCFGVPYIDHDGDCILANDCSKSVVVKETVGQYTGLTDKNDKKIFEGDIIKGKEKTTYVVKYCSKIASFSARAASPQKMLPCMTAGTMKYYEVIGNIHDNPELIEMN